MYFNVFPGDVYNDLLKRKHICTAGAGPSNAAREAVIRRLKMLAAKLERLMAQMAAAQNPNVKNSLKIRIEEVQAEIAMLKRELNA